MPPPPSSRRELLRIGGSSLLGLSLTESLGARALSTPLSGGPGWGRAKSVILIFLQGGPSHLDLWDPKDDVPDSVRSPFKTISSKVSGMEVTELLPRLAQVTDRLTFIRSMSYAPIGLFNHTAAHYQMLTGYTADKVSPSGQLDPPSPKDFPNLGSNIAKLKPPETAMLPFVMLPRPLQESNIIGKAGYAGFLGREYDPYTLYPSGDDFNETKMDRIHAAALSLRPELSVQRLGRRAKLRDMVSAGDPHLRTAVQRMSLDEYFDAALNLIVSGRAKDAFDLSQEPDALRDRYGRTTFGQSCLMARRFIEAGTRFVQVNWTKHANSDRHSWDVHTDLENRMRDDAAPRFDPALASLIEDMDERGLLEDNLVVAVGEFGRSPKKGLSTSGNNNDPGGRDHWPYCFTAVMAGAGIKRGHVHGESDSTGSAPLRDPVHPTDLLATIYHALGIDPHTMVLNHLLQPRELVPGQPVTDLFTR
ncbi:MAG: DUF1501 domain-containing protein [Planctomycetota bacterium]|nr:DUF1501 domain-containing protein [Planctomycetota bacterium]